MKRLSMAALIISIFFTGCSVGFVNKETTLKEQPFAVETMRGSVTEATRCVGRYWKKSVLQAGVWWKVNPEALPILASGVGIGRWEPPVSLVITFDEVDGQTIARAYMHGSFSTKDERRSITLQSLAACLDNTQSYYEGVKAIVLKNGDVIEGQIISSGYDVLKIRTKEGKISSYSFMKDVKQYIMKNAEPSIDNSQSYYEGVKAIVLKNGDVIEGQIISIDHDVLKIRTKEGRILPYSFMNDVKKYITK